MDIIRHSMLVRIIGLVGLVMFLQTACAMTYHARVPLDEKSRKDIEKRIDTNEVLVKLKHERQPKKGKVLKLDRTSLLFQNAQSEPITYQAIDFIKLDRKRDLHGLLYGSLSLAGVEVLSLLINTFYPSDEMTTGDAIAAQTIFFGLPAFIIGFTIGSLTHRDVVITFHPSHQK